MSATSMNSSSWSLPGPLSKLRFRSSAAFLLILLGALIAFEMFNYSTTDYALRDLLGDLKFSGMLWSTILAIAFCGIDFAGIARLFTPEQGAEEPKEVWYLFGAWILAATMNAILTWWGVSMAIANHTVRSSSVIDPQTITKVVPIFVAVMVWVIRILIIGSLSVAADRLMNGTHTSTSRSRGAYTPSLNASSNLNSLGSTSPRPAMSRSASAASAPRSSMVESGAMRPEPSLAHPEPTYHSLNLSSRPVSRPSAPGGDGTISGRKTRIISEELYPTPSRLENQREGVFFYLTPPLAPRGECCGIARPNPPAPFPNREGGEKQGVWGFAAQNVPQNPKKIFLPSPFFGEGRGRGQFLNTPRQRECNTVMLRAG